MTDETAKAILVLPDDVIIDVSVPTNSTFPQYEGHSQPLGVKLERLELQCMAKFWLLKEEILDVLDDEAVSAIYIPLFEKLAALEDK